jgi:hypothetical protein
MQVRTSIVRKQGVNIFYIGITAPLFLLVALYLACMRNADVGGKEVAVNLT